MILARHCVSLGEYQSNSMNVSLLQNRGRCLCGLYYLPGGFNVLIKSPLCFLLFASFFFVSEESMAQEDKCQEIQALGTTAREGVRIPADVLSLVASSVKLSLPGTEVAKEACAYAVEVTAFENSPGACQPEAGQSACPQDKVFMLVGLNAEILLYQQKIEATETRPSLPWKVVRLATTVKKKQTYIAPESPLVPPPGAIDLEMKAYQDRKLAFLTKLTKAQAGALAKAVSLAAAGMATGLVSDQALVSTPSAASAVAGADPAGYLGLFVSKTVKLKPERLDRLGKLLQKAVAEKIGAWPHDSYLIRLTRAETKPWTCPEKQASGQEIECTAGRTYMKSQLGVWVVLHAQKENAAGKMVRVPTKFLQAPSSVIGLEAMPDIQAPAAPAATASDIDLEVYQQKQAAYLELVQGARKRAGLKAEEQVALNIAAKLTSVNPGGNTRGPYPVQAPIIVTTPKRTGPAEKYESPSPITFGFLTDYGLNTTLNLKGSNDEEKFSADGNLTYEMVFRSAGHRLSLSSQFKVTGNFNVVEDADDSGQFGIGGLAGPSANMARFTTDVFMVSDLFTFVEPQLFALKKFGSDSPDPELAIFAGLGWGRIYPVATHTRVIGFLNVLHNYGLLKRKLGIDELRQLMEIIPNRWDSTMESIAAVQKLRDLDLLREEPNDLVKAELINAIEKSYGYKEEGTDFRAGIHYSILTGKSDLLVSALQFAFTYQQKLSFGQWIFEPMAGTFLSSDPFLATFLVGARLSLQTSARSRYVLADNFNFVVNKDISEWKHSTEISYLYWFNNLITISLTATAVQESDNYAVFASSDEDFTDYQLSFDVSLRTF